MSDEPKTVGELPIEDFVSIIAQLLNERRKAGDPRILDLTVKDFTGMMAEQLKSRQYAVAAAESGVAERVLTDWQGLQAVGAVTQPFRVRTMAEAEKFGNDLASFYKAGGKAVMVIAVAVVDETNGTYQPHGVR